MSNKNYKPQISIYDLSEFLMAFKNYSAKQTLDFVEEFVKEMAFAWDRIELASILYATENANNALASSPSPSPEAQDE